MKRGRIALVLAGVAVVAVLLTGVAGGDDPVEASASASPAAVLSVTVTRPQLATLPIRVPATGNISAWQEASVGAEADGLRLTEVRVNVGDSVQRGQILATFDAALIDADLAQARAAVALAAAEAKDAQA
ncbi:MAG: efflux transporter periplasmic adaptor subunit, partial [Xanthomonas sp.]|nr:efflux transporter periplasmic adaptor subunit [Xanthomonas sp.]